MEGLGYEFFAMSAATHQGTRELVQRIGQRLSELPPVTVYEPEYVPKPPVIDTSEPLHIEREDNTWLVEGPWLQRLMGNINFSDYESRLYFDKMLRQSGLFDTLEDMGIQDGDIVSMYDLEFSTSGNTTHKKRGLRCSPPFLYQCMTGSSVRPTR